MSGISVVISKVREINISLRSRPSVLRVLQNISWLFLGKILQMGVGLFVTAWIARYLGPEQFGLWNFAIAFASLFYPFATLGLDSIVIREIVKNPEKTGELLGTSFLLRLLGATVAFILTVLGAIITGNTDLLTLCLIALAAGSFFFQSFWVIDYLYQAHILSKYTVWSQNLSFLIFSTIKVILIIVKAPLITFAIVGLCEIIFGSLFLCISYQYNRRKHSISIQPSFKEWQFSAHIAKSLLKDSWPLLFGSIFAIVYMKIDLAMVREMLGNREAGYYSVAQRISESFLFITVIITQTIYPLIIKAKKISESLYLNRISLMYGILTKTALFFCMFIVFIGERFVLFLFGENYIQSISILYIYIWSSFFVFLSNGSHSFYLAENLQKFTMYRLLIGAIVNVILNIFLIRIYGLIGAAWASVISYAISSYLFNAFHRKLWMNFKMQTYAILNLFNPASYVNEFKNVMNIIRK